MHTRALDQQGQIAFAAQQRLHPVCPTHSGLFGDSTIVDPRVGALQKFEQALQAVVAQGADARLLTPMHHALAQAWVQVGQQGGQIDVVVLGRAALAVAMAVGFCCVTQAQQSVKLMGHQFSVRIELAQEITAVTKAQGQCHPIQVFVVGGQHMGLLIVQVLNAVLDLTQKHIGLGQRISGGGGHEVGLAQALQCG